MAQEKKSFRHESLQDVETIEGILKSIVNGVSKKKMTFSDEEGEILLEPEGLLHLKLKASQDENRHRFSLQISWRVEAENKNTRKKLSVSSK